MNEIKVQLDTITLIVRDRGPGTDGRFQIEVPDAGSIFFKYIAYPFEEELVDLLLTTGEQDRNFTNVYKALQEFEKQTVYPDGWWIGLKINGVYYPTEHHGFARPHKNWEYAQDEVVAFHRGTLWLDELPK